MANIWISILWSEGMLDVTTLISLYTILYFQQQTEPHFPETLLIAINKNGVSLIDPNSRVCYNVLWADY